MALTFIDLVEVGPAACKPPYARHSTLQIDMQGLVVLGNLPHGYLFRPTRACDRDTLVAYLQTLEYKEE